MSESSRRDFLMQSAAAAGALAVGSNFLKAADRPRKLTSGADRVPR
jgi:hypothetical protein